MSYFLNHPYRQKAGIILIIIAVVAGMAINHFGVKLFIISDVNRTDFGDSGYVVSSQVQVRWVALMPLIILAVLGLAGLFWPKNRHR